MQSLSEHIILWHSHYFQSDYFYRAGEGAVQKRKGKGLKNFLGQWTHKC